MKPSRKMSYLLILYLLTYSLQYPLEAECVETIEIGVIAPTGDSLNNQITIMEIAKEDINAYMSDNGHDYRFDYQIESAEGQASIHIEILQYFHSREINLIIGGAWSSQARQSLPYIEENDMILFSASSTGPVLRISDDNLFRLCPDDYQQATALADSMWSLGIDAAIVIYRDDTWGEGILNTFNEAFSKKGGTVAHGFRYDTGTSDFTEILTRAETEVKELVDTFGSEHVGILMVSFAEDEDILRTSRLYPTIYNVVWFATEGVSTDTRIIENVGEEAEHVKLFCANTHMPDNSRTRNIAERFESATGAHFGYFTANLYDIFWIYALSILEIDSADPMAVKTVIPEIAANYEGVTGNCELNEAGDRIPYRFDIWGVGKVYGNIEPLKYAYYELKDDKTYWDKSLITPVRELNQKPVADINGPYSGNVNEVIRFSSGGSHDPDGSIVEYRWSFGDGSDYSYSQNPTHVYTQLGVYPVFLRITDDQGETATATTQCTINPEPQLPNQPPAVAINGPYSGVEDESISFSSSGSSDPDGNIVEYKWNFGDGSESHSQNPSHTYSEAGTYPVSLTVTDNDGGTNTQTTQCVVKALDKDDTGDNLMMYAIIAIVGVAILGGAFFYLKKRKPKDELPKPESIDIKVEPDELPADGRSTALIKLELINGKGMPIESSEDLELTISTSGGALVSPTSVKKDELTGATTLTESVLQAIDSLFSRKESATRQITIKKGETTGEVALVSSLSVGNVRITVNAPTVKKNTANINFTEKRRYCMHCGTQMKLDAKSCPKCHLSPPSGVDVKQCPNCGQIIPSLARFCGECGASQPI